MTKKHQPVSTSPSNSRQQQRNKKPGKNLTWLWICLGAFVLTALVFLFLSIGQASSTEITVAQAHYKYQQGALFLDVRTQPEWDQGHISNSTLIPLSDLQSRLGELPHDRDIVVVCRSGVRSQEGVAILRQSGFSRSTCMSGGIQAWITAGYPVVK